MSEGVATRIREAQRDDAAFLSQLALRSKAYWGYPSDFLNACRAELTVDADRLGSEDYRCRVAVEETAILGFYALERVSESVYELDALFVEPRYIGQGIGRALVQDAIDSLSCTGAVRLLIHGDPNASDFYIAAGARQIGSRESDSIPGRYLPLFAIDVQN